MRGAALVCAAAVSAFGARAARADIFYVSGHVEGTTAGSGTRLSNGGPLTFTGNPGSFDLAASGGAGGTSGGLSDGSLPVASASLFYNLTAGTSTSDYVRAVLTAAASFDTHDGAYSGSIGSSGSAQGVFRYVGAPMPFFARRVVDGVVIPGAWFTPVAGTGASIDNGIITPGDYSFSLASSVDSTSNPTEDRLAELVIPAPGSALVLGAAWLCARRRR